MGNPDPLQPPQGKGTLIVTYHTGRNGERLDRVRFRLINDQKEQTLYPRSGTFSDASGAQLRRVTIPNLAAGHYTIEFIVPNYDDLFGDVPAREVVITSGEIAKIDQGLKPRYAKVKATAIVPHSDETNKPAIHLRDGQGKLEAESQDGELSTNNLLPGHYTLSFDPLGDYVTPDPIHFDVVPGAILGPFERHYTQRQETPSAPQQPLVAQESVAEADPLEAEHIPAPMTIREKEKPAEEEKPTTPPEPLDPKPKENTADVAASIEITWPSLATGRVGVTLRATKGEQEIQRTFRLAGKSFQDTLNDLPPGQYELSYELPTLYFPIAPQLVSLESGKTLKLTPIIQETRVIRVSSTIAAAEYLLTNDATGQTWTAKGKRFVFRNLHPGTYRLAASAPTEPEWQTPKEVIIDLAPNKDSYRDIVFQKSSGS